MVPALYYLRQLAWASVLSIGEIGGWTATVAAQSVIVPDDTLGVERSIVGTQNIGLPGVPIFQSIDGGATRGRNLFHSFQRFNISPGEAAIFSTRNTAIQNILVRVTGGVGSKIDGEISSIGAENVNLFLINPSGISFGRNSRVNVGGRFIATTADAVRFGDRGLFSATNPEPIPLLTIQPSALFFASGSNSRRIDLKPGSRINAPSDKGIFLVGGPINLDQATLTAPAGTIKLLSVSGPSEIDLDRTSAPVGLRANVQILNRSVIDVGAPIGGDIVISGENIKISDQTNVSADSDSRIMNRTSRLRPGNIVIDANKTVEISSQSQVLNQLLANQDRLEGGSIFVKAGAFVLNNANLATSNGGSQGNAGAIVIQSLESIRIDNLSRIVSQNVGPNLGSIGNAGNISLTSKNIGIYNASRLGADTGGKGNGGNITLQATESIVIDGSDRQNSTGIFSQINPGGVGNGGDIRLTASDIYITNGGLISTRIREDGVGLAGGVFVNADKLLQISGLGQNNIPSAISSVIEVGGIGKGGAIQLQASETILDRSQILSVSRSLGNAGPISLKSTNLFVKNQAVIASETSGFGNADDISLDVERTLALSDQSILSTAVRAFAIGRGGNIRLAASRLSIGSGSFVSSASNGDGQAGDIRVRLGDRLILNNGEIRTASATTSGGNIDLTTPIAILRNNANIKTNIVSGAGSGGSIKFQADTAIILLDDSDLLAFAQDGQGGNITLLTPALLTRTYKPSLPGADLRSLDTNGFVDINATGATSGIITLPDLNPLQNNRPELPQGFLDTDNALSRSCLARNPKTGKFYITGAGGIPPQPGDPTLSNYSTLPVASAVAEPTQIVEADGLYRLANGKLVFGKICQG